MNYWPAGLCNLAEMGEPLVKLCEELAADGKETAKNYFGVNGACSFHNADIWRKTTPADGLAQWNFWPMGYAWLCGTFSTSISLPRTESIWSGSIRC